MKKVALIFSFLLAFLYTNAQAPGSNLEDPVKWTSKIEKKSDTEYVLIFDATIEDQWHMYSQFTPDGGALPLEITFNNNKDNFEAVGKAVESPYEKEFNKTFGVDEYFWSHEAHLEQVIKVTNPNNTLVQANVYYQVCKEVCIQGENLFEFDLKALTSKEVKNFEEAAPVTQEKKIAKKP